VIIVRVAIFDFDGTLYKHETFQTMMNHLKEHPKYGYRYKYFLLRIFPSYIASKLNLYPKQRMNKNAMKYYVNALAGLTKKEADNFFKDIADIFIDHFNEKVVQRLHEHLRNDDYLMLVSGAYVPLLRQATKQYPFHQVVGTKIHYKKGQIKKHRTIDHIQGERKKETIQNILKLDQVDWKNSFAYADSYTDMPVFELVGHPIAVNPDDKLHKHAIKNNWEIL